MNQIKTYKTLPNYSQLLVKSLAIIFQWYFISSFILLNIAVDKYFKCPIKEYKFDILIKSIRNQNTISEFQIYNTIKASYKRQILPSSKILKKQGTIQAKLSSKPSFKNLINLQDAKATSRSKSKSKTAKSHNKISQIPNKSPTKLINKLHQNQSVQYTEEPSGSESLYKTTVKSQISVKSGSKSPKKAKGLNDSMKYIIPLKNQIVILQKQLHEDIQILQQQKKSVNKNPNQQANSSISDIIKLKNMSEYIDEYLRQFRTNGQNLQKDFRGKVEEIEKTSDFEQFMEMSVQRNNIKKVLPTMDILSNKLSALEKLLS